MLPQPVGLLKLMLIVFAQVLFKGENSATVIFMKYTFDIVMCQDTCNLICFKLGMMLNILKSAV